MPGNLDRTIRAGQPLKAFQYSAQDFFVVLLHEDCPGDDAVNNQIRRQGQSAAKRNAQALEASA